METMFSAITVLTIASTLLVEAVSSPVTQKQLAQFVAARQNQQRQFAYDHQPQSQLYADGGTQETADTGRPLPQQVYYGQQEQTRSLQRVTTNANQQLPEDYDPNPQYQFSFDIKDDESTNYHNRKETRDGDKISGSYSVVDSDGYIRTVTYTADPREGFKADVNRQPTDIVVKLPKHPTPGIAQQYQQLSPTRTQLARKQQTLQYLQASSPIEPQEYTSKLQQPEQVYIQPQPIHLTPSATATPKSAKVPYPSQVYQNPAGGQPLVLGLYGNAYRQ